MQQKDQPKPRMPFSDFVDIPFFQRELEASKQRGAERKRVTGERGKRKSVEVQPAGRLCRFCHQPLKQGPNSPHIHTYFPGVAGKYIYCPAKTVGWAEPSVTQMGGWAVFSEAADVGVPTSLFSLNNFYARFETNDSQTAVAPEAGENGREEKALTLSEHDVRRVLKQVNIRKAAGPDATFDSNTIVKFADDTAVIGLITNNDERAYLEEGKMRHEWEKAFAVCYCLQNQPPIPEQLGNARLTQRDPVQIPAHSEVVRWVQVQGGHNMVLQTPSPGEVIVDVRTTQAPAGVGSCLRPRG
ncbi:hypothetical protein SKAU_G00057940 [Synaphobranchus kaupii]|uniref:Uncharacterized protein n=1 Tax=Synaphobranchus kaupii TaxID=118154 RepID=A0A9Q1G4A1_SYNKA|nr:hypothetical protein SKAU_G00057940 [Synaphobranchus kaupii]